jgi:hypothetical protein
MPSSVRSDLIGDDAPLVAVALAGLVAEPDLDHRLGQALFFALVPELLERAVAGNRGGVANPGSALDGLAVALELNASISVIGISTAEY